MGFDVLVALKEVTPREGGVVPFMALHLMAITTAGQKKVKCHQYSRNSTSTSPNTTDSRFQCHVVYFLRIGKHNNSMVNTTTLW